MSRVGIDALYAYSKAGVSAGGGVDAYGSGSASQFVPAIFTKKVLRNFYASTVFSEIANTDYEGEIKNQGDTVYIRTTPVISISDYTIGEDLEYEAPYSDDKELVIDQAKYWAFQIDDVDKLQADIPLMNTFSKDAGERMKIAMDTSNLQFLAGKAAATNRGITAGAISGDIVLGVATAPLQLTATNIIDKMVEANLVLDEADIPSEGRWIVMPAWACALLKQGDLRRADVTGDSSGVIRTGLIGMVDRFKIFQSNNVYEVTDGGGKQAFYIHFGTKEAITFASQLVKTENLRIQKTFGEYYRGLNVYGRAVPQDTCLGELYVSKT